MYLDALASRVFRLVIREVLKKNISVEKVHDRGGFWSQSTSHVFVSFLKHICKNVFLYIPRQKKHGLNRSEPRPVWIFLYFGYLDIWIFGYLDIWDIWIFEYLDIWDFRIGWIVWIGCIWWNC